MFNIGRANLTARNLSKILCGSIFLIAYPVIVAGADISEKPERPNATIAYSASSAAFTPLYANVLMARVDYFDRDEPRPR